MRFTISSFVLALSMLSCLASPVRPPSAEPGHMGEGSASIQQPEGSGVAGMGLPGAEDRVELGDCREEAIRGFDPGPGELETLSLKTEVEISTRPEDTHGQDTSCEPDEDDEACLQRGVEAALDGRQGWSVMFSSVRNLGERVLDVEMLVDGRPVSMTVTDADALVTIVRMHEEDGKEVSVLSTEMRPAVAERVAVVVVQSPDAEPSSSIRRTMWFRWWPETDGPTALEQARERAEAAGLSLLQASVDPEGGYLVVVTCP